LIIPKSGPQTADHQRNADAAEDRHLAVAVKFVAGLKCEDRNRENHQRDNPVKRLMREIFSEQGTRKHEKGCDHAVDRAEN